MTETPFKNQLNEDDPEYRDQHASHNCTLCDWQIFSHEKYECSYCGDSYCPDHRLPEKHDCIDFNSYTPPENEQPEQGTKGVSTDRQSIRDNISEVSIQKLAERTRKKREQIETRQDRIKKKQKEQFGSPDVNLDGSLSEPEYEDDIQSIGGTNKSDSADPTRNNTLLVLLAVVLIVGGALLVYSTYL